MQVTLLSLAVSGALLREDDHAFIVFEAAQKHFHFITDLEFFTFVEFAERDDTFALVSDIDEHLTGTNFENATLDDASFTKLAKTFREKFLHCDHSIVISPATVPVSPPPPGPAKQRQAKISGREGARKVGPKRTSASGNFALL